jgi:hypothetical protein
VCVCAHACPGGVFNSIGDSQDIRFIGGLSIYLRILHHIEWFLISRFVVCFFGLVFYSNGFVLEMFSMGYVNIFDFFIVCVYGLNSLLFFPFILFCFMR